MKKIMELLQNMKAKNEKKDNKGFSLVELIIVIAIMAILVGIVGTQVLPYINKSKEAKDFQIINSYGTAATTAYSSAAEKVTALTTVTMDDTPATTNSTEPAKSLAAEIQKLTGYDTITKIVITIDPVKDKTIKTQAYAGSEKVFDEVVTQL